MILKKIPGDFVVWCLLNTLVSSKFYSLKEFFKKLTLFWRVKYILNNCCDWGKFSRFFFFKFTFVNISWW